MSFFLLRWCVAGSLAYDVLLRGRNASISYVTNLLPGKGVPEHLFEVQCSGGVPEAVMHIKCTFICLWQGGLKRCVGSLLGRRLDVLLEVEVVEVVAEEGGGGAAANDDEAPDGAALQALAVKLLAEAVQVEVDAVAVESGVLPQQSHSWMKSSTRKTWRNLTTTAMYVQQPSRWTAVCSRQQSHSRTAAMDAKQTRSRTAAVNWMAQPGTSRVPWTAGVPWAAEPGTSRVPYGRLRSCRGCRGHGRDDE